MQRRRCTVVLRQGVVASQSVTVDSDGEESKKGGEHVRSVRLVQSSCRKGWDTHLVSDSFIDIIIDDVGDA